jgi:hypothetical protein
MSWSPSLAGRGRAWLGQRKHSWPAQQPITSAAHLHRLEIVQTLRREHEVALIPLLHDLADGATAHTSGCAARLLDEPPLAKRLLGLRISGFQEGTHLRRD